MKKSTLLFMVSACLSGALMGQGYYRDEINQGVYSVMDAGHIPTSDGGYLVYEYSTDLIPGPQSSYYLEMHKFDASGTLQWNRQYSHSGWLEQISVVQTPDSGFVVCYNDNTGPNSIECFRLDAQGTLVFVQRIESALPQTISVYKILIKNNGNILICGSGLDQTQNPSLCSWVLIEMDGAGSVLWSKLYNMYNQFSYCLTMDTCANGDVVMAGYYQPTGGDPSLAVSRVSSTGSLLWSKCYPVAGTEMIGEDVVCTPDDKIYVIGWSLDLQRDLVLTEISGSGNAVWMKRCGNTTAETSFSDMTRATNGDLIVVSNKRFVRFDTSGAVVCAEMFPFADLKSVSVFANGDLALSGINATYNAATYMTSSGCGVTCNTTDTSVAPSALTFTTINLAGETAVSLTIGTHSFFTVLISSFATNICTDFNAGMEEEAFVELQVVHDNNTLTITSASEQSLIEIYDLNGRMVMSKQANGDLSSQLNISGLASSIYVVRVQTADGVAQSKIAVSR